uniref:Uncharacterized protein n=1 Tax=Janibacter limosus TaxID=53458 RepID=A0AC61U1A2_9MICO|nr:hypothetical protein [Janibacter limosus]
MLASSAMNGAVMDSTFNVFFKLKYARIYDAMLATPLAPRDIAVGEVVWSLIRGGVYALVFYLVALAVGGRRVVVVAARGTCGDLHRPGLRRGRHVRHDLHALPGRLRLDHARHPAALPAVGDLLPAGHLPGMGAADRAGDAALPRGRAGAWAHARRGRLGPAVARRLPRRAGCRRGLGDVASDRDAAAVLRGEQDEGGAAACRRAAPALEHVFG